MISIPCLHTKPETDLAITLGLAAVWWILGISWVIYHLVSFIIFGKLLYIKVKRGERIFLPFGILPLSLVVVFYAVSIILNAPQSEASRVLATLYNFSFWLMGMVLIIIVYNGDHSAFLKHFSVACRINIVFIFVVVVAAYLLTDRMTVRYPSLTALIVDFDRLPLLIQHSTTIKILREGIFANTVCRRAVALAPYATALAGTAILLIPAAVMGSKGNGIPSRVVFYLMGTMLILWSYSRIGVAVLLLATILWGMVSILYQHRWTNKVVPSVLLIGLLGIIFFHEQLLEWWYYLLQLRTSSSTVRIMVYRQSIETALAHNPWLGIGVKPRGAFSIPLGSHSMYVGLFLKSGSLGLLMFIWFQFDRCRQWLMVFYGRFQQIDHDAVFRKRTSFDRFQVMGQSFLAAMAVYFIFVDLDAPQLLAFTYFILVGLTFHNPVQNELADKGKSICIM